MRVVATCARLFPTGFYRGPPPVPEEQRTNSERDQKQRASSGDVAQHSMRHVPGSGLRAWRPCCIGTAKGWRGGGCRGAAVGAQGQAVAELGPRAWRSCRERRERLHTAHTRVE